MSNKIVVVNVYQCASLSGKYQKEGKKLLRSNAKMMKSSVDEMNENWQTSGRFYEIDKEQTEKFRESFEAQQAQKRENAAAKKELKEAVLDTLGVVVNEGKKRTGRKPKTE